MKFKIIAAVCKDRGIGMNNKLPWKIPEDMNHFTKVTTGDGNNAVIMGKNTFQSLPKPLENRVNLVLSKTLKKTDGMISFRDIKSISTFCKAKKFDAVWIIGGEEIYKQFLDQDLVDVCVITYIDIRYKCDKYFPNISSKWILECVIPLNTEQPFDVEIRKLINTELF